MRTTFDFRPIRESFGFSEADDRASARWLAARLRQAPYAPSTALQDADVHGRTVHVLGAADDAAQAAVQIPPGVDLWTADGATSAALAAGRRPSAIVTDLDGGIPDEVQAAEGGAIVFVHAHGDNRAALERWLSEFPPQRIVGTCQVEPLPPLLNPGGFTDGDRAVFLALSLGAKEVVLHGFDFERPGRYSGHGGAASKPFKLSWARRLLDGLIADGAPVRFA